MGDLFADPLRAHLTLSVSCLLFFTWVFAALVPPKIGGVIPDPRLWCLIGGLFGYFWYTGMATH